jgi:polysaccharide pyruvyl transferase WcaK-like protein
MEILHLGVHSQKDGHTISANSNAGDTVLFETTRRVFDYFLGDNHWYNKLLWEEITPNDVDNINQNFQAVVIGGGGLLLRDQKGAITSNSGWQWNCPTDLISKFNIPIIVFAVGYNRFRNQEDFSSVFTDNITTLLRKSSFFGLRNHGSIEALKTYIFEKSLQSKICFQPCPTTILYQLYQDDYPKLLYTSHQNSKKMAVNAAFDRELIRYGNDTRKHSILAAYSRVIKKYQAAGWEIHVANHKKQDAEFERFLTNEGVLYTAHALHQNYPENITQFYADKDLVIGMRGHAQMIPFGLCKNIISLISHDKMSWFLEDIGHLDWGVEVQDICFEEKLDRLIEKIGNTLFVETQQAIKVAQNKFWDVTKHNFAIIKNLIPFPKQI